MAAPLSPSRRLYFAARGLAYWGYVALTGITYDLGDFHPDADEVLAQLLERNG